MQHPILGRSHYMHAVNTHEQKPAFDYDFQLSRVLYNYVTGLNLSGWTVEAEEFLDSCLSDSQEGLKNQQVFERLAIHSP